MRRLSSFVLCTIVIAGFAGVFGCNPPSNQKRLILLTNGDDGFWDAMRAGMKDADRDFQLSKAGFTVEMDKNDNTPEGQIDKLNQYAGQGDIAAVAISVTDSNSSPIANAMRRLQEKGIKVIAIDSDINREKARDARFAYLGTDNLVGGHELGRAAKALRPEGGEYAAFVGHEAADNAIGRSTGFQEGAGDSFLRRAYLSDGMKLQVAEKNAHDALNNFPELDVMVGIWAYNAHAIVTAVKDRKVRDKTTIVVFDAAERAIEHMGAGMIDAMVVQNPYDMGYRGTRLMAALASNDQATIKELYPAWNPETKKFEGTDGDLLTTGLKVVVPDEKSPLKKEMFEETTEFLTLPEFKDWLAKLKLKSS